MTYADRYHLTPEQSRFLAKKKSDENVYCGMKMENRAVTFPQTKTILDGVNVPGVQLDDIQAILNMRDAWRFLMGRRPESSFHRCDFCMIKLPKERYPRIFVPQTQILSPRRELPMITAFMRTLTLYFLIMLGLRLTGKRQIGELEPSELVMTMMISDLAAVPMQDFGIPLLSGLVPILTLLALSLLLSQLSLRSLRLRTLLCGTPVVLIRRGQLQQSAMRKNRFTIDELMEELREQGISRIEDVKYAVLENSGQLSVFPWTAQKPPTAEQLGLDLEDDAALPVVLINDGRVIRRNLTACGRDEAWLRKQLSREKVSSPREVFLLTLDEQGQVLCVRKEREP